MRIERKKKEKYLTEHKKTKKYKLKIKTKKY